MPDWHKARKGGTAFPHAGFDDPYSGKGTFPSFGMSLRDWFAGQAIVGLMASYAGSDDFQKPKELAANAYVLADAMIEEREKDK